MQNSKSIQTLFDKGMYYGVLGQYAKKRKIFLEIIPKQSDTAPEDMIRVEAYKYDLERRSGKPKTALKKLKNIKITKNTPFETRAEYWESVAQCYLSLRDLKNTLKYQRKILTHRTYSHLAIERKAYYVQAFLGAKREAGEFDAEFKKYLSLSTRFLRNKKLIGEDRARAKAVHASLIGDRELSHGNHEKAISYYYDYYKIPKAPRYKVSGALKCLFCLIKSNKISDKRYKPLKNYFQKNKHALDPVDKKALKKIYDFVNRNIK